MANTTTTTAAADADAAAANANANAALLPCSPQGTSYHHLQQISQNPVRFRPAVIQRANQKRVNVQDATRWRIGTPGPAETTSRIHLKISGACFLRSAWAGWAESGNRSREVVIEILEIQRSSLHLEGKPRMSTTGGGRWRGRSLRVGTSNCALSATDSRRTVKAVDTHKVGMFPTLNPRAFHPKIGVVRAGNTPGSETPSLAGQGRRLKVGAGICRFRPTSGLQPPSPAQTAPAPTRSFLWSPPRPTQSQPRGDRHIRPPRSPRGHTYLVLLVDAGLQSVEPLYDLGRGLPRVRPAGPDPGALALRLVRLDLKGGTSAIWSAWCTGPTKAGGREQEEQELIFLPGAQRYTTPPAMDEHRINVTSSRGSGAHGCSEGLYG